MRLERASAERLREIGGLRWDDATSAGAELAASREEFADRFRDWGVAHAASHPGVVGIDAGTDDVVAFGFLAVTPRVPTGHRFERTYADVQSVWVAPRHRDAGVGGRLVTALLDLARELGVEHVTVHSSTRAVTLYERVGFVHDPELLDHLFLAPSPPRHDPEDP